MTIPILLIPGLSCTAEVWAGQITALWGRGPVMVADNTRGDSIAAIADEVLHNAPPRFALAGISMGGYIALEIWRRSPERVAGLALVDTQARADSPEATAKRLDALKLVRAGKFAQVVTQGFPTIVHPANVTNARLLDLHMRMNEAVGAETYMRQQQAIIGRVDSRPDLARIEVPAAVIVGEEDQLTPPALAQEMADGLPDATLAIIADAGHMALAEQPQATTAALLRWLDRVN